MEWVHEPGRHRPRVELQPLSKHLEDNIRTIWIALSVIALNRTGELGLMCQALQRHLGKD